MLSREYPFAHAVHLAAKSSVTKLTHQDDMFVRRDYSAALDRQPMDIVGTTNATPEARLVGTAAHLVISSLDLKRPVTRKEIEKTRDRLVKDGAIPANVGESIDAEAVGAFFESKLGSIVCDKRNTVWREWPFTFGLPVHQGSGVGDQGLGIGRLTPDTRHLTPEIVVVQGLIDLLVWTPEGLLVLDFKTDHVFGEDVVKRAEVYRGQLELYARAAAAICRDKVLERWLYFLAPRQAVQV
jgi:ATP-dependent helicase/nuclease subunit A